MFVNFIIFLYFVSLWIKCSIFSTSMSWFAQWYFYQVIIYPMKSTQILFLILICLFQHFDFAIYGVQLSLSHNVASYWMQESLAKVAPHGGTSLHAVKWSWGVGEARNVPNEENSLCKKKKKILVTDKCLIAKWNLKRKEAGSGEGSKIAQMWTLCACGESNYFFQSHCFMEIYRWKDF